MQSEEESRNSVTEGYLQLQTRTRRPYARYFGTEWTSIARLQTQKLRAGTLNNDLIQSSDRDKLTTSLSADFLAFKALADSYINTFTQETEGWHGAVNDPDQAAYWEAMKIEIATLIELKLG